MPIAINGSGTITGISAGGLPDATITQAELATGVGGTGPAFSVYCNTSQSLSATVYTKLQLNTELFDTASCFDSTTNYRFTPNVAGYYQFNGYCQVNSSSTLWYVNLYKNGAINNYGSYTGAVGSSAVSNVSNLIYMNGTTDYVELYVYSSASASVVGNLTSNGFSAALVRAA
jgi:hypothetical protein